MDYRYWEHSDELFDAALVGGERAAYRSLRRAERLARAGDVAGTCVAVAEVYGRTELMRCVRPDVARVMRARALAAALDPRLDDELEMPSEEART